MLTLDGLRSFYRQGTSLGVVGFPISHSLSPVFHNAALQYLAARDPEFKDWEYFRIEAPVEQLKDVIALCREKGFRGLNLTIPHKVEALNYVDQVDPLAARMGAVNTLIFEKDTVSGHNTDGYGVSTAVQSELGISIKERPVVVLGAGGASRAACVQCLAEGCSELWVGNRSQGRLLSLLEDLKNGFPQIPIRGFSLDTASLSEGGDCPEFPKESLLINTTSLGLKPDDPLPISRRSLESVGYVYDAVYGSHVTPLVNEARELGLPAADGLSMLLFQGNRSLTLWTGVETPIDVMRNAVLEYRSRKTAGE